MVLELNFLVAYRVNCEIHKFISKNKIQPSTDHKSDIFSKEFNDIFNGDQLRDLQKEKEVGNWLLLIGLQFESMKFLYGVLSKLEGLDSYLSKVDQSNWSILNWAL